MSATNDHQQLLNRTEPNQHLAKSITYAGTPLNVVLDNIKATVDDRPTNADIVSEYYDKAAIDAQMAEKAGKDHGLLENRDAPDQHPASAITFQGASLDTELIGVRDDLADRPTFVQMEAAYYDKTAVDGKLAAKAGLGPVTATENGLATPDLHTISTYSDIGITEMTAELPPPGAVSLQSSKVVDGRRYFVGFVAPKGFEVGDTFFVNGRRTVTRMADGAPAPEGLFAAGVQKIASLDTTDPANYVLTFEADPRGSDIVGTLDAVCTTTGTRHVLDIAGFTPPYPATFTVRTVMDADYQAGNDFVIDGTPYGARTATNEAAPQKIVGAGALIEISIDTNRGLAFFKSGVGGSATALGERWNISVGNETPVRDGIHVPGAVRPSKVYVDWVYGFFKPKVKQVEVCCYNMMILLESGRVLSCGMNNYGQLGRIAQDGTAGNTNIGFIPGLEDIVYIVAGDNSSYFLNKDGKVFSCGYNGNGELGRIIQNASSISSNLGRIPDLSDVVKISHGLFLCRNGDVYSCGNNSCGQLGRYGASGSERVPNLGIIPLDVGEKVVDVFSDNYSASYFLTETGRVWSCGASLDGKTRSPDVKLVPGLSNIVKIRSGFGHYLFLKNDGTVFSYGKNEFGQLGRITSGLSAPYVEVIPGLQEVADIFAGGGRTFFLLNDGTLVVCGRNEYQTQGGEGRASTNQSIVMNQAPFDNIIHVSTAENVTAFLTADGTIFSGGVDTFGNLGRKDSIHSSKALGIVDLSGFDIGSHLPDQYEENSLLIGHGVSLKEEDMVHLYADQDSQISVRPKKVYQIQGGQAVDKPFILRKDGMEVK